MSILDAALDYAKRGWETFPVHGIVDGKCTCGNEECANPGKHPSTPKGFKNASKDHSVLKLLFAGKAHHNIGLRTGAESGVFIVDVDGPEGEHSISSFTGLTTLEHRTGRGRHLFFRHPGKAVRNSTGALGAGVDVRGDGGYIVLAPSKHISGATYHFTNDLPIAEAPAEIIKIVTAKERAPSNAPRVTTDFEIGSGDIGEMLGYLNPDMEYGDWIAVGMALHSGGHDLGLWDAWSARGSKYRVGECEKMWRGFKPDGGVTMGTLWSMAMAAGWVPPAARITSIPIERHPARKLLERINNANRSENLPPVGGGIRECGSPDFCDHRADEEIEVEFDPCALPGLIGDTVKWIVGSSVRPQPMLALCNVLAALGAVTGQKYASELDTRTNLYIVGTGPTGCGKDHSRKSVKRLFVAAGLGAYLHGDSVVSAPGLLRGLETHPRGLLLVDEFGMFLKALSEERAPTYLRQISKTLMQLYSDSSSVFASGHYATTNIEPIVIHCPNLCIYGTTTEESYTEALTRKGVASGELNRFVVLPTNDPFPERRRELGSPMPPDAIVERWRSIGEFIPEGCGNLQGIGGALTPYTPHVIVWNGAYNTMCALWDKQDEECRTHRDTAALWMRYAENSLKIAMLFAIARDHANPHLTPEDLLTGAMIVEKSIHYMVSLAELHMADSRHEEQRNYVLNVIRRAPRGMTKTELTHATRKLSAKERGEVIRGLIEDEGLVKIFTKDGETNRYVYAPA